MEKLREMPARALRAYRFVTRHRKTAKKSGRKDKMLMLQANKVLASEIHRFVVNDLKGMHAESVLEIGCGEGALLRALAKQKRFEGSRLFGIDKSRAAIGKARRMVKASRSVYFSVGRNDQIPYVGKFDLIFAVLSFHEWENGSKSISYILSRLNKNGMILIYDTPPVRIKGPKLLQKNSMLIKATFVGR